MHTSDVRMNGVIFRISNTLRKLMFVGLRVCCLGKCVRLGLEKKLIEV